MNVIAMENVENFKNEEVSTDQENVIDLIISDASFDYYSNGCRGS